MKLEINPEAIQAAIQAHLDKAVKDGIDYKIKEQLDRAIAAAITPEIVEGYAAATVKAMTDPAITERIVREMNEAIGEAVRMTMQEAVVSVIVKLRSQRRGSISELDQQAKEIRDQLFPSNAKALGREPVSRESTDTETT